MDAYKNYQPYTIPNCQQEDRAKANRVINPIREEINKKNDEQFAEIEINQEKSENRAVAELTNQSIKFVMDDKRALFYSMRQISRESLYFSAQKAFYYQGLFMKDFEDDYEGHAHFSSYYPYYHLMGYEQLRTYFSWRTQVRKGNISNTSLSYAFLYIYELLNNIGVTDPQDGLDRLAAFWLSFRKYDQTIDPYMFQWIKDYHIYYQTQKSFKDFAKEHKLQINYPTIFCEQDNNDNFDVFAAISKYNIKKSVFYSDQTKPMIQKCFYFIINRLGDIFNKNNKCFDDILLYQIANEPTWRPFERALFYQVIKQQDRQVVISKREVYNCRQDQWTYKTAILTEQGKQLIAYIMKEMESSLRRVFKFRHKITANPNMCDIKVRKMFDSIGASLPKFINDCVLDFYKQITRREVKVNIENLNQIREQSLQIQEKLIVDEDYVLVGKNDASDSSKYDDIQEGIDCDQNKDQYESLEEDIITPAITNAWTELKNELSEVEIEALSIILLQKYLKGFADDHRVMLEVLVDQINDKAMDHVGDAILEIETDDIVNIYDEYKDKIREMVIS